jgi:hypothetical protein
VVKLITFADALHETRQAKRHLLLGNGFSIALFPDRFRYGALLDEADFSGAPQARKAFDILATTDFEVVVKALADSVRLLPLYSEDADAADRMRADSDSLKDLLVGAIAGRHPERPSDIGEKQYAACREFLAHFIGDGRDFKKAAGGKDLRGKVYTLSYDLLLYWTLLHDRITEGDPSDPLSAVVLDTEPLLHDDGFRAPQEEPDAEYVTWEAEGAADGQNVHFLHGGLHLYDVGPDLQKICWERSGGIPLVDQIRAALAEGKFPLFVSEGGSDSKLARIRHSGYLQRSLKSLASSCRGGACLFIFGHSLAANDDHVLRQIENGTIRRVFISLHGDPESAANRSIIARAERMAAQRDEANPLDLYYFDADSAKVWG